MKKLVFIFAGIGFMALAGCVNERYLDLQSGDAVVKDEETGKMVLEDSREPVEIYVDTESGDTIYASTGAVINGSVHRDEDGNYSYSAGSGDGSYKVKSENGEYKLKVGDDYKKEVEKDGDITIKDGDTKIKIDGETGERKVKKDN